MPILSILVTLLVLLSPLPRAWGQSGAPAPASSAPAAAAAQPAPPQPELTPDEKADAEIGKSAAAELEKQYGDKILKDPPDLPRIMAIVDQIRPVTEKPHQTYQAKVIGIPQINALSLPGGYLYFTQGLLEAVESDDELAAVAAHEMGHVCLGHARKLMGKDKRYSDILAPLIIASILVNSNSVDPAQVAAVGSLVVQDALNHYGREAETEADSAAVRYLHASKRYNPVAVLTVVEGLARMEAAGPKQDLGVFQTHPDPEARVEAVIGELNSLGIPVERRRVIKSIAATAATVTKDGKEIGELRVSDHVVAQPAAEWEGASPLARAQRSADTLNPLLLADLQLMEIGTSRNGDVISFTARGDTLLTITPDDAAFHKATVDALAQQAMDALRTAFQEERVKRL